MVWDFEKYTSVQKEHITEMSTAKKFCYINRGVHTFFGASMSLNKVNPFGNPKTKIEGSRISPNVLRPSEMKIRACAFSCFITCFSHASACFIGNAVRLFSPGSVSLRPNCPASCQHLHMTTRPPKTACTQTAAWWGKVYFTSTSTYTSTQNGMYKLMRVFVAFIFL